MLVRRHDLAVEQHGSRRRRFQSDDHASDRRLAATGLADQSERFPLVDGERDVRDGVDCADLMANQSGLHRELFGEALDTKQLLRVHLRHHLGARFGSHDDGLWAVDRMEAGEHVIFSSGQFGLHVAALVRGVATARREATADDLLREVRRQTGDRRQFVLGGVLEVGHRRQQGLGVGVAHRTEQIER